MEATHNIETGLRKNWHSEALRLFSYCHHSLRNMTFHHMSHLCKAMGTKRTMKHTENLQIQDPKREESLMYDNSMTLANMYCGSALVHWMGCSEEVEAVMTPPWRRPSPAGTEGKWPWPCVSISPLLSLCKRREFYSAVLLLLLPMAARGTGVSRLRAS